MAAMTVIMLTFVDLLLFSCQQPAIITATTLYMSAYTKTLIQALIDDLDAVANGTIDTVFPREHSNLGDAGRSRASTRVPGAKIPVAFDRKLASSKGPRTGQRGVLARAKCQCQFRDQPHKRSLLPVHPQGKNRPQTHQSLVHLALSLAPVTGVPVAGSFKHTPRQDKGKGKMVALVEESEQEYVDELSEDDEQRAGVVPPASPVEKKRAIPFTNSQHQQPPCWRCVDRLIMRIAS
ncbi:hypothetical protein BYT27DRAFT_7219258 [Phlegmacium glaucopus]|nr:hypothetical protein BYT27DRAFT_7219258 [Phlegmacium glaucopus]